MKHPLLFLLAFLAGMQAVCAQKRPYQLLMQDDHVRYQDVKAEFDKARETEERVKEKAIRKARRKSLPEPEFEENEDEAKFYRWEQWRLRHLGPDGSYDPAYVPSELNRFEKSQASSRARKAANPVWKELGPFTAPTTSLNNSSHLLNGYNVGRLGAVAFHPTDTKTIYSASPGRSNSTTGGLWKTIDGGVTWKPLFDQGNNLIVTDVAVSTRTPQLVITTGSWFAAAATGGTVGYGIQKSTDGGLTWAHFPFRIQYEPGSSGATTAIGRATNIVIDPADDNHLLVICQNAVLYSLDGGLNWVKAVTPIAERLANYTDIELKPGDSQVVYVGGTGREQTLRSTDGGKTFTQLDLPSVIDAGPSGRVELAVTDAAPDYLYLLNGQGTSKHAGLYRLNTATGAVRVIVPKGSRFATNQEDRDDTQLYWCQSLGVSPADTSEMHVGMVALMSSFDGGRTWEYRHGWSSSKAGDVHSDVSSFAFQPVTNRLFVTSDGGLNGATGKRGAPYEFFNNIAVSQIYFLAQSATVSDRMLIGLQDNGSKLFTNGTWQQVGGGDGISCIIDDANPNVYYATSQNGYLLRVANGFTTYLTPTGITSENTSFYTPLDYHQASKTLFLGSNSLWRKNEQNYLSQWENVKTFETGETIQDVFVAPSDVKTIYVRTFKTGASYRFYCSTDGGATWERVLGDSFDAYISSMVVSPSDPKTIYVSRYVLAESTYHVMKSADNGRTWTKLTANLPRIAANAIAMQEGTDEALYVALDQGVYYKDNSMSEWVRYGSALPNATPYDLDLDYAGGKLKVATHGRGVWETDLAVPVGQVTALTAARSQVCAGAAMPVSFQVSKGNLGVNNYTIQLSDANGSFANPQVLATVASTTASVTIPATAPIGTGYQIRVLRNNNISTADTSASFSVLNLPGVTLSAPAEVVYGNPVSVTLAFAGSGPWQYSLNGDTLRSVTASSLVRSLSIAQATSYQVTSLSNICGVGAVSAAQPVAVIPTLAVQNFSTTTLCAGQGGSLSVVQGGAFLNSSGYLVQLSDASGSFSAPLEVGNGTQNSLTYTIPANQPAGTGYRLRVVGNKAEKVDVTPTAAFAVNVSPTAVLSASGDLSILQTTSTTLRLTFTGTPPYTFTLADGQTGTTAVSPFELTVKPDKTATYGLAGVANGCGSGTFSGSVAVTVIPLLAVDPARGPVITVLPNPTTDQVRVETSLPGIHALVLYDVLGREQIRRTFQQSADVGLRVLTKGIYIYRVISPDGAVEGRLLIE
ncbi:T9SS type A sorting domain-containing protein [Fibrivirga algicola]|uniref:T9SS type A sorting domain-containing protein n=1 Tax=Fibrivirga algicola TaxID=2950420 RepID=A0ABX0Q9J9_9BACT|nr:T9SS type A sorting domain-containing protein [Fibrivirga algicola]NID08829.1 T9SS type A sorting domain-containing protein [Fibrivirga algicola]